MDIHLEEHPESLLQTQTRQIVLPCGRARELTYTLLMWRSLEYLVDRGHATLERLLDLAEVEGWEPPNAPFEMRFATVIAYWCHRLDADKEDYDDYCRGRA